MASSRGSDAPRPDLRALLELLGPDDLPPASRPGGLGSPTATPDDADHGAETASNRAPAAPAGRAEGAFVGVHPANAPSPSRVDRARRAGRPPVAPTSGRTVDAPTVTGDPAGTGRIEATPGPERPDRTARRRRAGDRRSGRTGPEPPDDGDAPAPPVDAASPDADAKPPRRRRPRRTSSPRVPAGRGRRETAVGADPARHVVPVPDREPEPDTARRRRRSAPVGAAGRGARLAGRLVLPLVLVALTVGVMLVGVFPTRTWLDQRAALSSARAELAELETANAERRERVDALLTDAEIERLARQEYGFAKVGEEVYHVLPPPEDPVRVPEAWPFTRVTP